MGLCGRQEECARAQKMAIFITTTVRTSKSYLNYIVYIKE
jgi:hypothetical protein